MSAAISSLNFYGALRDPMQRLQQQIVKVQNEIASGRRDDVGLDLGTGSGASVALRIELERARGYIESNKLVSARLSATQDALGAISNAGVALRNQLTGVAASQQAGQIEGIAQATLDQIRSVLNTSFAGQYLFSGEGPASPPIHDISASGGAAQTAISQAFQAAFGTTPGSSAASAITGAQMQSFLDAQFAILFEPVNWKANWSGAADASLQSRISDPGAIASSVTANETAIRTLAQGLAMLADLGIAALGADARTAVVSAATTLVGRATDGLTALQARVSGAQSAVEEASSLAMMHTSSLQARIGEIEGVDPSRASVELTTLSTQLQASYDLTSRLSQLSILKYI